ncbi:type 1 glutamine amidotransferase [Glaciibacter psychrotolerans]|uniref:Lipid II isoglutaminyl synthase (glutamine-hydrolyzing) subunit GatD n=1 Tax=Glaciibacter psychrotolerans TaxID=670054 RepID=A0A7Z0J5L4_9MICO|nr:cobyric acid synthase [Leifsonia psychrotolerans]NYJ19266.1 hypothetical protein [Leifsonia psychrotolerans]
MTAPLTIVSLLPELLGTNGDAANARVLATRVRWAGYDANIIEVRTAADLPDVVDAVVVGSGSDTDLVAARDILATLANEFRVWSTGGVPILAIGTGWELLSWGIEQHDSTVIEGLGLVAGRAVPRPERVTDDLVVASKYGRLIGFENHARDYVGAEGSPLGRVISGSGNGAGFEGIVMGEFFGTHLHGPVLARNPGFADHLLTVMLARHGAVYQRGADAAFADAMAQGARNQIASRLSLETE